MKPSKSMSIKVLDSMLRRVRFLSVFLSIKIRKVGFDKFQFTTDFSHDAKDTLILNEIRIATWRLANTLPYFFINKI